MEDSILKYEKVSPFFTCVLCDRVMRNATAISECLDTFCRECIERKIVDENLNHCPICNVDLGCSPLDKLRTDNNKITMISKILTSTKKHLGNVANKRKNSKASLKSNGEKAKKDSKKIKKELIRKGKQIQKEAKQLQEELPITPQEPITSASEIAVAADVKKDEKQQRGIEILDEVSTILSARKAKNVARKKFIRTELDSTSQPDKVTSDGKNDDIRPLLETFTETLKIRFKSSSKPESSNQQTVFQNVSRDKAELRKEKAVAVSEPLNWFVETTNTDKSLNESALQENGVIPMHVDSSDNEGSRSCNMSKVDVNKLYNPQTEAGGDQNEFAPSKSTSLKFKIKRMDSNQEKRVRFSEDLNLPAQPEIETKKDIGSKKESAPIWFSLIASKDRELGSLPQISSHYIKVMDGNLTVSYIKKYLVKKLDLTSEAEVEILLGGKPVYCSMQVQNLMELWLETMSKKEMIETSVGSSAEDFVMVLSYGRKA